MILDFLIRIFSRVSDHVRQLGGRCRRPQQKCNNKTGGAGFNLLKVELSFQVHEPGFWGMFDGGTLMATV